MLKEQKGITLVALIITIIVMLILAGVSISLVVGEQGVLTQAQNAGIEQEKGAVKEAISLGSGDFFAACYDTTKAGAGKAGGTSAYNKVSNLITAIQKNYKDGTAAISMKDSTGTAVTDTTSIDTTATEVTITLDGVEVKADLYKAASGIITIKAK